MVSIRILILVGILSILFPLPKVLSDEKPDDVLTYRIEKKHVVPGHTAHFLNYGLPIGEFIKGKIPEPPKKPENPDLKYAEDLIRFANDLARQEATRIQNRQKKTQTALMQKLETSKKGGGSDKSDKEVEEQADPEPVSKPEKLDLNQFSACATKNLPILKQMLQIEAKPIADRSEREIELLSLASERVDQSRANGIEQNVQGLVCGNFLGFLGGNAISLVEDVKFLMTVLSRSQDKNQLQQLIETATVSFHPKADVMLKDFWAGLWKQLSIRSVFSNETIPSWDQLAEEIKGNPLAVVNPPEGKFLQGHIVVKVNPEEVMAFIKKGKEFLEMLREGK